MKVALLLPAEPEKAPYIQYYIDIFRDKGVEYDIIAWNRSGNNPKVFEHLIMYEEVSPDTLGNIKKTKDFWGFKKFIEKIIRENHYDYLVVHTIILAVFISPFLLRRYRRKYILDIRDECSLYKIIKLSLLILLKNSYCSVISSWGFKIWLPKADYVISHNIGFRWKEKMAMPAPVSFFQHRPLNILTIGQIRHFDTNKRLLDVFKNKVDFEMCFAGVGIDVGRLRNYCIDCQIFNVKFTGLYLKEGEDAIVQLSDLVNILLPYDIPSVLCAMANRFYVAVLNYKPVIVNAESIQAQYVGKYNLGVIVQKEDSIEDAIKDYVKNFDITKYLQGRMLFQEELKKDLLSFETKIQSIVNM